jgi:hypothetical protein
MISTKTMYQQDRVAFTSNLVEHRDVIVVKTRHYILSIGGRLSSPTDKPVEVVNAETPK